MLDELVMVVASPRTKELLVDYAEHNKVQYPTHIPHVLEESSHVREESFQNGCRSCRSTRGAKIRQVAPERRVALT